MVIASPILTDLDSRAEIKGSRDPLGIQAIWTSYGHKVVSNLTTVSTSVVDFKATLIGYAIAQHASNHGIGDGDLPMFLKWEQLAAYARYKVNNETSFRGTQRTQKYLSESDRVTLSADLDCQILSNQKTYGLAGLYTSPTKASGLLEGNPPRLTAPARQFVDDYLMPNFQSQTSLTLDLLVRKIVPKRVTLKLDGQDMGLLEAIGKLLAKPFAEMEKEFYRRHILWTQNPEDDVLGPQRILAQAMYALSPNSPFVLSPNRILELAQACESYGEAGRLLSKKLQQIRTCEFLIAPAVALFGLLLRSDGQRLEDVVEGLRQRWEQPPPTIDLAATEAQKGEFSAALRSADAAHRWMKIAGALAAGAYDTVFHLLFEQNRDVMNNRNGTAPWIAIREGRIEVRYEETDSPAVPDGDRLRDFWVHPYFLPTVHAISLELDGEAA